MQDRGTDNALIFSDAYLGYPVSITAYFFDGTDKLGRIILGYENVSNTGLKDVYGKLAGELIRIYGSPQFSQKPEFDASTSAEFRISELNTWKTKDCVISFTLALAESGTTMPGLVVVWGDIENDPASRNWAKSDLSNGEEPENLPKDFKLTEAQKEEIRKSMGS